MTNDRACNMDRCKNSSFALGRHISELILKTIDVPASSITDKDISKFNDLLSNFQESCLIEGEDKTVLNLWTAELKNIYPTAKGRRITQPLADLMTGIHSSRSKCRCEKK